MTAAWKDAVRAACPRVLENEPLARHTTWGIGGPADLLAEVHTLGELAALRHLTAEKGIPVFLLGAGSNLLVSDRGIRGLVLQLKGDFRTFQIEGERVTAGAGVWLPTLVRRSADQGLAGLESLAGVPGTVGGALVMNAGTAEAPLGRCVERVESLEPTGDLRQWTAEEADFQYRHSVLEGQWIVRATLRLMVENRSSIMARVDGFLARRSRTQPLGTRNGGSVFKNPPGDFAGRLIEQAGMKGVREGGAQVSERHANFFINVQNASAEDMRRLIRRVQERVLEQFGVRLEPEVKIVGEW